ncbi:two-component sensor histidine kinase DegS [Clostridium carnis]
MDKQLYGIANINIIIKKVISEINIGKSGIFEIADRLRDDFERKKIELEEVKNLIKKVIVEVDELEALDKKMRNLLANASRKTNEDTESKLKEIYEEALDIRVKFITKKNEEKDLIKKRDSLERTIKSYMNSIEEANNAVNQINIALGYLEGDILKEFKDIEDSGILLGIKILENQEMERRRIAREIHDGPAQYIANTMIRIDLCKMILQKDLNSGLKELDDLKLNVKMALKEVRGVLCDLKPMHLEELGLNDSIKEMANEISRECNININLNMMPIVVEIEEIIQVAVYRLTQEILNNVKKHSKATKVIIRVESGSKYIMLMIKDDGVGFNIDNVLKKSKQTRNKYGLIGILDRVNQLQGEISLNSSENEGTTYKIKLPINRKVRKNE